MPAHFTLFSVNSRNKGLALRRESTKGFTLIELLVVISILAILSVIGFTVFTNVQKSARDAHRRAEIDAVAKALEVHYHGDTALYECVQDSWFSENNPTAYRDPLDETSAGNYPGLPGCGGTVCSYPGGYCYTTWKFCTDLEADGRGAADTTAGDGGNTNDFCKSNQQ